MNIREGLCPEVMNRSVKYVESCQNEVHGWCSIEWLYSSHFINGSAVIPREQSNSWVHFSVKERLNKFAVWGQDWLLQTGNLGSSLHILHPRWVWYMVCVKCLASTYLSCLAVQAIFKLLGPTISTQVISLL